MYTADQIFGHLKRRAVFAGGWGLNPCEKWLTRHPAYCIITAMGSILTPRRLLLPFQIVSMQHCVLVNQYNTTLSGCDTSFPHMGGATLDMARSLAESTHPC